MADGCLKWQSEGLNPPQAVIDATNEYLQTEDSIGTWIEERCECKASFEDTAARLFASWKAWAELSPPTSLKATQEKIKTAIADQQAYLLEIERRQSSWNLGHAKVRSSSANLQAAYGDLMRLFSVENATNKQAFYDYLCALDFL